MRIKKIVGIVLFSILLLVGCVNHHSPAIVYLAGVEHNFGTVTVKLENDEAQERFVLYYNILEQDPKTHFFSFTFMHDTIHLRNSEQFEYSDNLDSKIEFNENGYYLFDTSRIFYVSYKNADAEIKNVINDKNGTLEFPMGTFVFSEYAR